MGNGATVNGQALKKWGIDLLILRIRLSSIIFAEILLLVEELCF